MSVMRQAGVRPTPALKPADRAGVLASSRAEVGGGGEPLPRTVLSSLGRSFGADFSAVRVHTDSGASRAARVRGARAFTVGHEIVFGAGEWAPDTTPGRRLLGHELAHVVQQRRGGPVPGVIACAGLEHDAQRAGDALVAGLPVRITGASGPRVALAASEPRSLIENLVPSQLTPEQVDQEVHSIHAWLLANPGPSADRDRLLDVLPRLEALSTQHDQAARQGMSANVDTETPTPAAASTAPTSPALQTPPLPGGRVDQNPLVEAMAAVSSFKASDVASNSYTGIVNGRSVTIDEAHYQELLAKVRTVVEGVLGSVRSKAEQAAGRYEEQQKVDAKHWIVAPIVKAVGRVKDPKPYLDGYVGTAHTEAARADNALGRGDLKTPAMASANAELAASKASKMVSAYVDQIINAGEMTVTGLEYVKIASEAAFLLLATIATAGAGGAAASTVFGFEVGTGTAVAAIGAGWAITEEVGVGLLRASDGEKVDWGQIATHAAVQILMARFGGKVAERVGGALAKRYGPRATELATTLIMHEANTMFATVIDDTVLALRGRPITMKQFEDELVQRMLDPRGLALAVVQSRLAGHLAARRASLPRSLPRSIPSGPSARALGLVMTGTADAVPVLARGAAGVTNLAEPPAIATPAPVARRPQLPELTTRPAPPPAAHSLAEVAQRPLAVHDARGSQINAPSEGTLPSSPPPDSQPDTPSAGQTITPVTKPEPSPGASGTPGATAAPKGTATPLDIPAAATPSGSQSIAEASLDARIAQAGAKLNPARQRTLDYQAKRAEEGKSIKGGPIKELWNTKEEIWVLKRQRAYPDRQILAQARVVGIKSAQGEVTPAAAVAGKGRTPDYVEVRGSKVVGGDLKSASETLRSVVGGLKRPAAISGTFGGKIGAQHGVEQRILTAASQQGAKLIIEGVDAKTEQIVRMEVDPADYSSEVTTYEEVLPN